MFHFSSKYNSPIKQVMDNIADIVLFIYQDEDGYFCLGDTNNAAVKKLEIRKISTNNKILLTIPDFEPDVLIQKCIESINKKDTVTYEAHVKLLNHVGEKILSWVEIKLIPVFNDNWECDYITLISHDITERKLKEKELILEKKKLELIFNHAADAVFTFDTNGDYVSVNTGYTNLFGWTEEEVLSDRTITILPDKKTKDFENILGQLKKGHVIENHQSLRKTREGTIIRVLSSYAPIIEDGEMIGGVAVYKDITHIHKMGEQLRESENRYRLIAEYSSDLIQMLDPNGFTLYASPSHEHHFGVSPEFYINKSILNFAYAEDKEKLKEFLQKINQLKIPQSIEYRRIRNNGEIFWLHAMGTPILDSTGQVERIVFAARDICKQKEREIEYLHKALHDELTNLPNRRLFEDRLLFAMNLAKRSKRPIALLTIDFDNFKMVNDTYGHGVGDHVLKVLAERIKDNIRASDTVSRVGGDEFHVILPELENRKEVLMVANRILNSIDLPIFINAITIRLTASIGISFYEGDNKDKETLLSEADYALYEAKRSGKSTLSIYNLNVSPRK